jgi:hypothetical protein
MTNIFKKYKYEIIIGVIFFIIIMVLIFNKPIFGWLRSKSELQSIFKTQNSHFGTQSVFSHKKRGLKNEELCRSIFESIFNKPFPSIRPNFLKNPLTKKNLELDGYNEELKLAFEYNGIQHYKFNEKFHRSEKDLIDQQRRDKLKQELCDKNNVTLITVPYTVNENKMKPYILTLLKINDFDV